jgi:pimeloyl-ACP methyl ester carboxylesterase
VDATRGLRDYSDDVHALVETLGLSRFHLLGWSLGGNIAMQYAIDHPARIQTLTLHAPGSPYGYGGTHGPDGVPNYDDFAGSGGGLISPLVVERYRDKDFTADSPFSPRSALRTIIVKPGFTFAPEREDALVEQMLLMVIGDEFYPGDAVPSPNWPFSAPGVWGSNNALSPKYGNLAGLADTAPKPPILWVRGADDQLVGDVAAVDPAALGKLGVIPGWPGDDVCPPQPMIQQIRAVLDRYRANGGAYEERVFADCGHAPLFEKPEEFRALLRDFLAAHPLSAAATPDAPTPAGGEAASEKSAASAAPAVTSPATTQATQKRGLFGFLRRR